MCLTAKSNFLYCRNGCGSGCGSGCVPGLDGDFIVLRFFSLLPWIFPSSVCRCWVVDGFIGGLRYVLRWSVVRSSRAVLNSRVWPGGRLWGVSRVINVRGTARDVIMHLV